MYSILNRNIVEILNYFNMSLNSMFKIVIRISLIKFKVGGKIKY